MEQVETATIDVGMQLKNEQWTANVIFISIIVIIIAAVGASAATT